MKALFTTETKPLGEMLRLRGLVSEEDLKSALALQQAAERQTRTDS